MMEARRADSVDLESNAGIGNRWAISMFNHKTGKQLDERVGAVAETLDYATLRAEDAAARKAAKDKKNETGPADVETKRRNRSGRGGGRALPHSKATTKLLPKCIVGLLRQ